MSVRDIEFQEAIRRASERYGKHKRAVQQIWRRAEDSPTYALSTARELAVKTRYWRRRGRRYLYSRFGVKVRSRGAATIYAGVRPERSPGSSRERLLRAEAVIEHAEWESVWRAVWKCQNFGPADQARMACKFACEAMRQSPALWGFFIEKDLEPDDSVRQHAAAQLAGWLDNEVRRFPRTRAPLRSQPRKGESLKHLFELIGLNRVTDAIGKHEVVILPEFSEPQPHFFLAGPVSLQDSHGDLA
jgi:hypothetical protein